MSNSITSTPSDVTLTAGYFSSSKSGTISWNAPTIPDGAIIVSCVLTGKATASNSGVSKITVNNQSLTVSTSGYDFTIDLGTDISKTSVDASMTKSSSMSNYNVKFTNMVYTVTYDLAAYTVIFKNEDGTIIKTVENVASNTTIKSIQPTVTKEGYYFLDWYDGNGNVAPTKVTSDLTLIAKFNKNPQVTIKQNTGGYFIYNNTNYEGDQTFNLTGRPQFDITIVPKEGYGLAYYTMKGEKANDPIKQIYALSDSMEISIDLSMSYDITIQYELLTSKFAVAFKDYDNSIIQSNNVTFGDNVTVPDMTTKIRLGYKFTGWEPDISEPIVENTTFVAQYTKVLIYTIEQNQGGYCVCNTTEFKEAGTFNFNVDKGSTLKINAYANEGYIIKYMQLDDDYDIVDNGVDTTSNYESANIQTNEKMKITYVSTTIKHVVTFKDYNSTVLKTEEVYSGDKTTPPNDPTRDGYTFIGWDKQLNDITEDIIITAKYRQNSSGINNKLYIGDKAIKCIYVGDKLVNNIFIGSNQIF